MHEYRAKNAQTDASARIPDRDGVKARHYV